MTAPALYPVRSLVPTLTDIPAPMRLPARRRPARADLSADQIDDIVADALHRDDSYLDALLESPPHVRSVLDRYESLLEQVGIERDRTERARAASRRIVALLADALVELGRRDALADVLARLAMSVDGIAIDQLSALLSVPDDAFGGDR